MSYKLSAFYLAFLFAGFLLHAQENEFRKTILPNVTSRETSYPEMQLNGGDVLHLEAGGCVQTGGSGLSWKRFVNPSGENSDKYYFGLIKIPGITTSLERIDKFLGRDIPIPAGYSGNLVIGYEDDNYADNGYDRPDNGTENQCAGEGNAYITIVIKHPASTGKTTGSHPSQETPGNDPGTHNDPGSNPVTSTQSEPPGKPFLETALGIITAITAFIGALIGLFQLFKKK